MNIEKDMVVSIDYKLTGDDGNLIDASEVGKPLAYLHGHANIIEGLEEALDGKEVGNTVKISIPPEKAYGHPDAELVDLVPKSQFEDPEELEIGGQIIAETEEGQMMFTVLEITDGEVKLDGNHPLAGMTLNFDVEVKEIRKATSKELGQGHADEPDEA